MISFEMCFWIICHIPATPGNCFKIIEKYTHKFVRCLPVFVTFSAFIGTFEKTRQFLTCNVALCCKQVSIRCSLSTYLRALVEQKVQAVKRFLKKKSFTKWQEY